MNKSEQFMTYRKANQITSKSGSVVDLRGVQIVPVYRLNGVRCRDCMSLSQALLWNVGTCWFNIKGREVIQQIYFASTNVDQRGGVTRSSDETFVMEVERRGYIIQLRKLPTNKGRSN